ncbi:MAG: hypothetical protein M3003_10520 [Candidatus Dormibacteraeota bacterium]|nr:hypothetical protein [Candidatus Dormibacteraeota bacterium]
MRFAEALGESDGRVGATCRTGHIIRQMDDVDATALAAVLDVTSGVPSATIARALQKMGHKIQDGAVNRHRRGDCQCV